jgi:DnaJ-class molecular chaperone
MAYERELLARASHWPPARGTGDVIGEPIDLFRSFHTFRPGLEELLDRWQQNFTHRHEPKSRTVRDLNVELVLSPAQARAGGSVPLEVPLGHVCATCEGTGVTGYFTCDACEGHGLTWETARVDVLLSPPVRDHAVIEVPLGHLGVRNFVLRIHARVA